MSEERLCQILRVTRRTATAAQERVQGRPICLAKAGHGGLHGLRWLALSGEQHHAPVGGLEGGSSLLQCAWNAFHSASVGTRYPSGNTGVVGQRGSTLCRGHRVINLGLLLVIKAREMLV